MKLMALALALSNDYKRFEEIVTKGGERSGMSESCAVALRPRGPRVLQSRRSSGGLPDPTPIHAPTVQDAEAHPSGRAGTLGPPTSSVQADDGSVDADPAAGGSAKTGALPARPRPRSRRTTRCRRRGPSIGEPTPTTNAARAT